MATYGGPKWKKQLQVARFRESCFREKLLLNAPDDLIAWSRVPMDQKLYVVPSKGLVITTYWGFAYDTNWGPAL